MKRKDEIRQESSVQNQDQHAWEHIPNDELEIVSPISYFSPSSTACDPSQYQTKYDQDRQISDSSFAIPRKQAEHRYDEVSDTALRPKRRRFLREWWQEILSAVSSILCLVAIVVILYKVNGHPLSDWNEPVSLNAVISLLSTAGKAGLILPVAECISQLKWIYLQGSSKSNLEQLQTFDSASRGPAGSLQFFFRARGAPLISYFACLIVIVALALDPFTQQIIRYNQSFQTPVPHLNSTVRHSQTYDRGDWYGANFETVLTNQDRQNDDAVLSGMVSGLYGNLPLPPFSCPGVNCTHPEVTSLGVCSTCEDVTERTVADCKVVKDDPSYADNLISTCNYTLPGGTNLTASATKVATGFGMNYPTLKTGTSERSNARPMIEGGSYNLSELPRLYNFNFVRFDNFETPGGDAALHDGTEWMKTMTAQQCVFELCAWSFTNWSHLDGTLQEGQVTQSKLQSPIGVVEPELWPEGPFILEASDPGFPGNNVFEVGQNDRTTMINMFYMMLYYDGGAASYFTNSLYLANPDIPRTLDAIARGITYNMMDGPNSTISQGQVFKTETFIRVRWEWLILSISTVAGSVALLAATIVKTCATQQRAWKSSLVPLLYADVTIVPNGGDDWDNGNELRRKATISAGVSAVPGFGTGTALSK